MRKRLLAGFLFSALVLSGSVALAADNWIGTWKMNAAKSKASAGQPPKSLTLKFETTPDGTRLSSDGAAADGTAIKATYTSKFDGKDVAWTGNPDADMAAPMRVDANTYTNTWKKGGKPVMKSKVVVAADGKTMTITQEGKNAKGEAINSTAVYDKQ